MSRERGEIYEDLNVDLNVDVNVDEDEDGIKMDRR